MAQVSNKDLTVGGLVAVGMLSFSIHPDLGMERDMSSLQHWRPKV
jgi:hypothetical protein